MDAKLSQNFTEYPNCLIWKKPDLFEDYTL